MSKRLNAGGRLRVQDDGILNTRSRVVLKFQAVAPNTVDTLLSVVKQTDGVDAVGATSIGVTAGKRLRITHMKCSVTAKAAAAAFANVNLRSNPAGATVLGSPSLVEVPLGITAATVEDSKTQTVGFPEGLEFKDTDTLGISASAQAVTNKLDIELHGYEYTPAT
jgi:hypothetical protein